jgi:hypothetical protein
VEIPVIVAIECEYFLDDSGSFGWVLHLRGDIGVNLVLRAMRRKGFPIGIPKLSPAFFNLLLANTQIGIDLVKLRDLLAHLTHPLVDLALLHGGWLN